MNLSENEACYILSNTYLLGVKTIQKLKGYTSSYAGILEENPRDFHEAGLLGDKQTQSLEYSFGRIPELLEERRRFLEEGIEMFCPLDTGYPKRLQSIDEPPLMIYVRGHLPSDDIPSASIIGARICSGYGVSIAEFFAGELAKNGVSVISGMAYGIDGAAARGALKAGKESFAVLGSGVDVCYPRENYDLYRMMSGIENESPRGGIISEFPPKDPAVASNFIMRNRLIAGLGDVLIVIEAREKSGTSITVGYALDQGKEVFAVPGRITDPLGKGCNKLIRDGAFPLIEPDDVLQYLGIEGEAQRSIKRRDLSKLSDEEKQVWEQLRDDPRHIEDIAVLSGIDIRKAMTILSSLEFKKYAESSGGAYYKRI